MHSNLLFGYFKKRELIYKLIYTYLAPRYECVAPDNVISNVGG